MRVHGEKQNSFVFMMDSDAVVSDLRKLSVKQIRDRDNQLLSAMFSILDLNRQNGINSSTESFSDGYGFPCFTY